MMTKDKDQQFEKLQNLWMQGSLEELERKVDKFNIFTALKLDNMEIRHSNFLAWLMNPRESHNIGDYFLKEFLKNAIKGFVCNDRIKIKPRDIIDKRFYECDIRREYKNIDILIINEATNMLCLIENKIWSGEHSEQLERYAQIAEKEFKDYKKLHIFLTPESYSNEPLLERIYDKENNKSVYYVQMDYSQVVAAIEKTLKHRGHIMPEGAKLFVEHYKKMVERNIMNKIDKEVKDFCRALYRDHKEAIDLIWKCTDNVSEDITTILKQLVAANSKLILDKESTATWTKFYPCGTDGKDLYLQFCTDNDVRLELVVMNKNGTEGLLNSLIEKLNLDESFITNSRQGYSVKLLETLVSEQNYYNLICLPNEELKEQLQMQLNKLDVMDVLIEILEKTKCTSSAS